MLHTLLLLVVVLSFCKVGCRYTNILFVIVEVCLVGKKILNQLGIVVLENKNGEMVFLKAILEKISRKIQGIRGKYSIYLGSIKSHLNFLSTYIRNDPKSTFWCPLYK